MSDADADNAVVVFYHKHDCHLCAVMAKKLAAFQREFDVVFEIVKRDIDDNADWRRRYRVRVPVLVVDDNEVCCYFFNHDKLAAALTK